MGVLIHVGKSRVFFRRGEFRCCEPRLERRAMEEMLRYVERDGGPPLSSKDPELCAAHEVAKALGGTIKFHERPRPQLAYETFFRMRQRSFDFGGGE